MTHDPSSWSKFLVKEARTRNLDPSFALETHKKFVREKWRSAIILDEDAVAAVVLLSMMNDNKRHAVAAQTARSRCKVPSVQYV